MISILFYLKFSNLSKKYSQLKITHTQPTAKTIWQNDVLSRETEVKSEHIYRVPHSCIQDVNLKCFNTRYYRGPWPQIGKLINTEFKMS